MRTFSDAPQTRCTLPDAPSTPAAIMPRRLDALYRFPVKGLSAQPLAAVDLVPGQGFPKDRAWALGNGAHDAAHYAEKSRMKTDFLMLMHHEALARLRLRFDDEGDRLALALDGRVVYEGALGDPADGRRLEDFIAGHLGERIDGRPVPLSHPGRLHTNVAYVSDALMHAVSLINLKSVSALEADIGRPVDPLRFRGNLVFDGEAAWEELDWVGRTLRVGEVVMRGVRRTRRCPATDVDPVTGQRDMTIPQALMRTWKHADLGLYAEVVEGGRIAPGDAIEVIG